MTKTCYACGRPASSKEHVPPLCLFPEQKDLPPGVDLRKNLITVPSCDEHNTAKSQDDEYMLALIASHYENNQLAENHFAAKVLRALKGNKQLSRRLLTTARPITVRGAKSIAVTPDAVACHVAATLMAKAIYFHHFKRSVHNPMSVTLNAFRHADLSPRADIRHLEVLFAQVMGGSPRQGANPEVFYYQIHEFDESMTLMRLVFYEGLEILAVSSNDVTEWHHGIKIEDA